KDPETKTNRCTLTSRCNPPIIPSNINLASPQFRPQGPSRRSVQRPVSASAPPVKGVLSKTTNTRNPKMNRNQTFSKNSENRRKNKGL
ncbi:hypothetical protein KUV39_14775, partial [Phaeobacter italicus]|uniref:hypothetical protein n=1 Tax=Phaeobacter italicus TaxID=481446 RepID=UPI001C940FD7